MLVVVVVGSGVHTRALMKETKQKTLYSHYLVMHLHAIALGLTFAGLRALEPTVISVFVAGTSAVLIPSTPRSATTESAGLLKLAALRALHLMSNW